MMKIEYNSIGFPKHLGKKFSGKSIMQITSSDLLLSAITVGRASYLDVFKFGKHSIYEIVYRCHIILANLRVTSNSIIKSPAFTNLDPSEKASITFSLGLTLTNLFASKLLNVPWLLHLDVYSNYLASIGSKVNLINGNSRPDLIGLDNKGNWLIFESKGRSGKSDARTRARAACQKTD